MCESYPPDKQVSDSESAESSDVLASNEHNFILNIDKAIEVKLQEHEGTAEVLENPRPKDQKIVIEMHQGDAGSASNKLNQQDESLVSDELDKNDSPEPTLLTEPLEEWVEALQTIPVPEPLAVNAEIQSNIGLLRIVELLKSDSQINLYRAISKNEIGEQTIWLREAFVETEASARLQHEAEVLRETNYPIFPQFIDCFESNGKTFLITEQIDTDTTFANLLADEERQLSQVLLILVQIAFGLARLHSCGWIHLGLRPSQIALGKPIKIFDCSYATRLGQKSISAFSHVGYSSPDLNSEHPVDARDDVYAVGALLYHAVTGKIIPETGPELSLLPPIAGVKQILAHCLMDRESRYRTMDELHQQLLGLKRRLETRTSYSLATASTIGLEPTRTTNQDAYAYLTGQLASEEGEQVWAVACVADGMGGMASGEIASEVAVKAVLAEAATAFSSCRNVSLDEQAAWVKQWVQTANRKVYEVMEKQNSRGGCTLICTCLIKQNLTIAHVGDCRLYRLRGEEITLLTRDHSLAMASAMQKQIELDDVRQHPDRSKVTRSLGDRHPLPDYYVDTLHQVTAQMALELKTDDVLLLCSDGLWEPVLEQDMSQIVRKTPDLQAAANALVKVALQRGASDNATVLLLRLNETTVPQEG